MTIDMAQLARANVGKAIQEYVRQMENVEEVAKTEIPYAMLGNTPDQNVATILANAIEALQACKRASDVLEAIEQMQARGDDTPIPGQTIYVETSLYIDHGQDDVHGGLATVAVVYDRGMRNDQTVLFVRVKEHPKDSYNWDHLKERQEALQRRFGGRRAHQCPEGSECLWRASQGLSGATP